MVPEVGTKSFLMVYCSRMSKALVLLLLFLAGCTISRENKIDATIRNDMPVPLVVKVFTPLGSTTVVIPPGETWSGSLDRRLIISPVKLVVELPAASR